MRSPRFAQRSDQAEWLDATRTMAELAPYLADLRWLNATMLGHWAVWRWLRRAMRQARATRRWTVLDVGCGDGSLLRSLARCAERGGIALDLIGVDIDPQSIRIARAAARDDPRLRFATADAFGFTPDRPVDVVVSSLVAHHLSDGQIVALLQRMDEIARAGWLVYDLQRHAVPYHAIGVIGRLTRLHPMVVNDGRISVRRSLTRAEWHDRIDAAGLQAAGVRVDAFLYRWLIGRLRPAPVTPRATPGPSAG